MWLCFCGFIIRGDVGCVVDVSWIISDFYMMFVIGLIVVVVVLM